MNETAKYSWNLLEFKQTTLNKRLAALALQACCAVITVIYTHLCMRACGFRLYAGLRV